MLRKIDRYIIKKYFSTFFFTALLMTLIALVIDLSERVDDMIEEAITFEMMVTQYYIPFVPWINGLLWPLFAMIAVIFFTARMARNSEIISILSSGVSYWRMLLPFMIAASILTGVHLVANHLLIPQGNKIMKSFENKYIFKGNEKVNTDNIHIFLSPESKVFIRSYRKRDTAGTGFRLESFNGNELVYLLKANQYELKELPNRWQLRDYEIREWKDGKEYIKVGRKEEMDTTIALYPDDFVRYTNQQEMMTTAELRDFVEKEKAKGLGEARKMQAEIHRRTSEPFTIIILTLIGAAVASRKVRGGYGVHIAMGIGIGALFIILSKFAFTATNNLGLSAMLSMWVPNIIFSIVAFYLILRAQK